MICSVFGLERSPNQNLVGLNVGENPIVNDPPVGENPIENNPPAAQVSLKLLGALTCMVLGGTMIVSVLAYQLTVPSAKVVLGVVAGLFAITSICLTVITAQRMVVRNLQMIN